MGPMMEYRHGPHSVFEIHLLILVGDVAWLAGVASIADREIPAEPSRRRVL